MNKFMQEDFLLKTEVSKRLFHEYAAKLPIIDYHCHTDPKEIYENRKFENITQMWLGGDHYKWRIMRSNGVDEKYITGNASDKEKFEKFAESLTKAIGNPMFHWCHLELKKYFGYQGVLSKETADEVWDLCNEKIRSDENLRVRGLIKQSNVEVIGTTDDPCDTLEWHDLIAKDQTISVQVLPSFRPDKAINIEKDGWLEYIQKLADVCQMDIKNTSDLEVALAKRIGYFNEHGCGIADHGMDYLCYQDASKVDIDEIMQSKLNGNKITVVEAEKFKTWFLLFCGRQYAKLNWVQQWHFNCLRNPNRKMFDELGPDTGFDAMSDVSCSISLSNALNALNQSDELPKTIIYSLNSHDNEVIGTIIGSFQGAGVAGKIQHGSGWWFNDTKQGMINQMTSLANLGLLGNFVGMLTDSRSFLSYTRHEYFRRIMCNLIGEWVDNGEYPEDEVSLKMIVEGISYGNAKKYFNCIK